MPKPRSFMAFDRARSGLPFNGDSPMSTAMSVLKGDLQDSPQDTPAGPRRDLWLLCRAAISQDKERRPATAKEFRERLQEILAAHTLPALEDTPPKNLKKESPRAWYALGALVLVAGLAFFGVSTWLQDKPAAAPITPRTAEVKTPQSTSSPVLPDAAKLTPQSAPATLALSATKPTKPKPTEPKELNKNLLEVPAGQSKFSYAKGLFLSGKIKDAATLLAEVAKEEPNNSSAHRWLGDAYQKLGKKSQAVAQWKEFLRLDPGHSEAKRVKEQIENNQ